MKKSQRIYFTFSIAVIALAFSGVRSQAGDEQDPIDSIVANLEKVEEIYHNHDVKYQITMRMEDSFAARFKSQEGSKPSQSTFVATASSSCQGHFVSQGNWFRLDRSGGVVTVDGDTKQTFDLINAFDGTTLRRLSQHAVANISKTRREDRDRYWPHSMMLSFQHLYGPLSLLLRGNEAVKQSPYADQVDDSFAFKGRFEKDDLVKSFQCAKVALEIVVAGNEVGRFELWLAQDRNLVPVKLAQFTRASQTIPSAIGEVREWKEILPGIWSPVLMSLVVYDPDALVNEGVQKVAWTQEVLIEDVNLSPNYPQNYFSEVEIPDGVKVCNLDSQGKIVSKYTQGHPVDISSSDLPKTNNEVPSSNGSSRSIVWGIYCVSCISIIVLWMLQRAIKLRRT